MRWRWPPVFFRPRGSLAGFVPVAASVRAARGAGLLRAVVVAPSAISALDRLTRVSPDAPSALAEPWSSALSADVEPAPRFTSFDRPDVLAALARAPATFVSGSIFFDSDIAPAALRAARLVSATALRLLGRSGTGSSGCPLAAALSSSIICAMPGWSSSFKRGSRGMRLSS
jgi:hypothetical protein